MPLLKRRQSVANRKGRSRISVAREVNIGLDEQAPRSELPSLDFDRVVNSYSIEATKKRLLFHHNLFASKRELIPDDFCTFKESFELQQGENGKAPLLRMPYGKQVTTWVLTLLTGMICGLIAILILYCVEKIVSYRSATVNLQMQFVVGTFPKGSTDHLIESRFLEQFGMFGVFIQLASFNMFLALLSSAMCVYWAPNAVGSGIPEVKAYLNGVRVPSFADMSTFLTKIIGTILSVSSGLVVGPEGPLVHIGAIIGRGLTNTTYLDVALREMQRRRPCLSGWLGCAKTDAFGQKKVRESLKKMAQFSRSDEEQLSLLIDDEEEPDFGSLQPLPGNFRSRSEAMRAISDMSSDDLLGPAVPVTRTSLFFTNGESLPVPEAIKNKQRSDASQPSGSCNPKFDIFSNIVSSLSVFRNDIDRRDLISIGVAVGFAAAFGAPVGGLLYSIEEASSFYSLALMWRTLAATALGTFMIAMYHGDLSRYSILSLGGDKSPSDNSALLNRFHEIPWYIIIGIAGGLLGALFNESYKVTSAGRAKIYGNWKMTEIAVVSFLTTSITFLLPFLLPKSWVCTEVTLNEGKMSGEDAGYANQFNCQAGEFNQVAAILLGSRDEALNDILTDPTMFEASTLLMCGLAFLFLMMITFGVSLPSGLFMPTLLTGSSLGGFAGIMIRKYYLETIVPAHLALLGAAAMLGGVQRTTVSLCVILMEATGQTKVLIPLIISIVIARYVGDIFTDGYYHIIMHIKHFPFLEHHIKQSYDIPTVANVMTSPVVSVNDVETAGTIETILRENPWSAFPVVNLTTKEYIGIIRRDQLVALLECEIYIDITRFNRSRTQQIREVMQSASEQEMSQALIRDDDIYTHRTKMAPPKRKGHRRLPTLGSEHSWLKDNLVQTKGGNVLIGSDEAMPGGTIPDSGKTVVEYDKHGNLVVKLSGEAERNKLVDIGAAMNRGAYSVVQNTPLSKAYIIFTALGLRTLVVLGKDGSVVGMVTRSNLLPEYMESRTGLRM